MERKRRNGCTCGFRQMPRSSRRSLFFPSHVELGRSAPSGQCRRAQCGERFFLLSRDRFPCRFHRLPRFCSGNVQSRFWRSLSAFQMSTMMDATSRGSPYAPAELEKLGRQRPKALGSAAREIGFCFSLLMSMFIAEYFISGFNLLLPTLSVSLSIPPQAQTWPASVFSLVTGAFLLPLGRLADMKGGYLAFVSGLGWFLVWSIVAGFSRNYAMLIACRALQGFGPAAFLPSGIMILGSTYRPGPRKNLVFSLYGAFAPLGFFGGIFFAGVCAQYLSWKWYFFIGSMLLAIVTVTSYLAIPSGRGEDNSSSVKMDWWGAATIVPGLLLIVFAITDGAHSSNGWATPYIPVSLAIGCLLLAGAVLVEGWVAKHPLLPPDLFKVPGMKALVAALFFQYGTFGIFLFYASF